MARAKKSEFLSSFGTAFQAFKAITDAVLAQGGSDDDLRRLISKPSLAQQVAAIIMDKERGGDLFPSQIHAADLIPQGWMVVEDVAPSKFHVKELEFISFLNQGESSINCEVIRQRAVTLKANLGLVDGKRILAEQDKLPVELRDKYIVLPGTLLRAPDGLLRVAYLFWDGGRWCLSFRWLGCDWVGHVRLARRRK